jgi:hypothetical protein
MGQIHLSGLHEIYDMKPGDVITVEGNGDDACYEAMCNNKLVTVVPHFLHPQYPQIQYELVPSQKSVSELMVRSHKSQFFKENEDDFSQVHFADEIPFDKVSFKAAVYTAMKKYKVEGSPIVEFENNTIRLYFKVTKFDVVPYVHTLYNSTENFISISLPQGVNRNTVRTNFYRRAKELKMRISTAYSGNRLVVTKKTGDETGFISRASVLRTINYAAKFDAWLSSLPYDTPTPVPEIAGLTVEDKGYAYIAALCSRRPEGCFKVSKGVVTRRSVCLSKDKEDGHVCLTVNGERVYKCATRSVTGITNAEHKVMRGIVGPDKEYR